MRLACTLLLCCLGVQAQGAAAPRQIHFDIGAQSLSSALLAFSTQSGLQVLAADSRMASLHSPGVHGHLDVDTALRQLLAGTTMTFRYTADDTVVLTRTAMRAPARRKPVAHSAASLASAGDGSPDGAFTLDEVIVTAQRREESLQATPVSVTTLDAEQLAQRGITTLTDLSGGAAPSLRISSYIGRTSLLNVAMRGIHSGDATQISRDAGVGVYIDGVYLGRAQGLGAEMLDVERMEILRGPQGTLFGRNAVGGAIQLVPRRPSGEFSLRQTLSLRSNDGIAITSRLDLPRMGQFAAKIDATHNQRDGMVQNRLESAWDYGQYRRWGLRGQLLWEPADTFTALYAFDRSSDQSAPYYLHLAEPPATATLAPMFAPEPHPVRHARTAVPLEPSIGNISGHALTMDWLLADTLSLRSITAHRALYQSQFDNWAGSSDTFRPDRQFSRASLADMDQTQFSQELQLNGEFADLHFVAGAYYFTEDATEDATEFMSNQFNASGTADRIIRYDASGVPTTRASINKSRSRALFGQGTWILPGFDGNLGAIAGLRYSVDDKHGRLTALQGAVPPPQFQYRFHSSRVDPTLALQYEATPDLHTYIRWSSAYRAGGANSRSVNFRTFGPEEIGSWEAGLKAELPGRRARVNLALYSMRYEDLQIGFLMPGNPVNTETINTSRPAHMRGAELEFTAITSRGLRVGGSYAWSDIDIPRQVNPFSGDEVRLAPMYTPRHALTLELDHAVSLPGGRELLLHVDGNYWSGQYTHASDTTLSKPAMVMNLRATLPNLAATRGRLSLALWCRNFFNRTYEITGISSSNGPLLVFGDPRSFGVDATIHLD